MLLTEVLVILFQGVLLGIAKFKQLLHELAIFVQLDAILCLLLRLLSTDRRRLRSYCAAYLHWHRQRFGKEVGCRSKYDLVCVVLFALAD